MTLKPPAYLALIKRAQSFVDFEKTLLEESMRDSVQYAKGDLVDVGCGDKPYEALFAPKVSKYVGIEYNETYGTSFYKQHNPKADITYSGDRLPFGDASFDTVLSNQVGEHVPHPEAFFAELARVLRPGGTASSRSRSRTASTPTRTTSTASPSTPSGSTRATRDWTWCASIPEAGSGRSSARS